MTMRKIMNRLFILTVILLAAELLSANPSTSSGGIGVIDRDVRFSASEDHLIKIANELEIVQPVVTQIDFEWSVTTGVLVGNIADVPDQYSLSAKPEGSKEGRAPPLAVSTYYLANDAKDLLVAINLDNRRQDLPSPES